MKIIYQSIFDVGKPRFKCGAGAAAAFGAGALGNMMSNIYASNVQQDINRQQIEYSREASALAFDRQNYQYEKYLSPAAQAEQLNGIGLNAASVLGKGAGVGNSMPTVAPAQVPNLRNPAENYTQLLKDTMQAVNMYSDSKKKDSEVGLVLEQVYGQQLSNYYQETQNYLLHTFGEDKASAELKDLYASAFLKYATGAKDEAVHDLTKLQEMIAGEEFKITQTQAANIAMMIQKQLALIDAQTGAANASASQSWSQADLNRATKVLTDKQSRLTGLLGDFQVSVNAMKQQDASNYALTAKERLTSMIKTLDKESILSDKDITEARRRIRNLENLEGQVLYKEVDALVEWLRERNPVFNFSQMQ